MREYVSASLRKDWKRPSPSDQDSAQVLRRKLDGKAQAYLVALTCSEPPEGRRRWTMQMLADKMVEVGVVERMSDETVRRTLKKGTLSRG